MIGLIIPSLFIKLQNPIHYRLNGIFYVHLKNILKPCNEKRKAVVNTIAIAHEPNSTVNKRLFKKQKRGTT